ncbi:hypothetical protein [Pseudoalteromonas luteoviolacea]|uniref:hypothetical protein n=1 Tax=Pseudoalteromonas luteoviolacea TaxID=43657 RepID=UPI00114ECC45|nr:hypothetical protein [Pseudoalteromonas luteoviolacea]TQF67588.1 hypothetical protein FLM44_20615 [Pseudoalteromonas luteoviolacea]
MQRSLIGLYLGVGFIAGLQVLHLWSGCNSVSPKQITEHQPQAVPTSNQWMNSSESDASSQQLLQAYIQAEIAQQLEAQTKQITLAINQLKPAQNSEYIEVSDSFEENNEAVIKQQEIYSLSMSALESSIAVGHFDESNALEMMSNFNHLSDAQKLNLITTYSDAINAGQIHFDKPLPDFIN